MHPWMQMQITSIQQLAHHNYLYDRQMCITIVQRLEAAVMMLPSALRGRMAAKARNQATEPGRGEEAEEVSSV